MAKRTNFVQIPRALLDHVQQDRISWTALTVLFALWVVGEPSENGIVKTSGRDLAGEILGCSRKMVDNALIDLENKGYILRDVPRTASAETRFLIHGYSIVEKDKDDGNKRTKSYIDLTETKETYGIKCALLGERDRDRHSELNQKIHLAFNYPTRVSKDPYDQPLANLRLPRGVPPWEPQETPQETPQGEPQGVPPWEPPQGPLYILKREERRENEEWEEESVESELTPTLSPDESVDQEPEPVEPNPEQPVNPSEGYTGVYPPVPTPDMKPAIQLAIQFFNHLGRPSKISEQKHLNTAELRFEKMLQIHSHETLREVLQWAFEGGDGFWVPALLKSKKPLSYFQEKLPTLLDQHQRDLKIEQSKQKQKEKGSTYVTASSNGSSSKDRTTNNAAAVAEAARILGISLN